MSKKPARLYNGIPLTSDRLKVLQALARCPSGSGAVPGVLPGGLLAALVMMGLAERTPRTRDQVGGLHYQCTAAGYELGGVDASAARTGGAS